MEKWKRSMTCQESVIPQEMTMWFGRMDWVSTKKGMAKWIKQQVHSFLPSQVVQMAGTELAIEKCWLEGVCVHNTIYSIFSSKLGTTDRERRKRKQPKQLVTGLEKLWQCSPWTASQMELRFIRRYHLTVYPHRWAVSYLNSVITQRLLATERDSLV